MDIGMEYISPDNSHPAGSSSHTIIQQSIAVNAVSNHEAHSVVSDHIRSKKKAYTLLDDEPHEVHPRGLL